MAQWGNTDDAANSVTWAVSQLNKPANTANQTALYGNTTMGAFEAKEVNGQYGISSVEAANTSADTKFVPHAGWNLKTTGTGSLASLTIVAGGTGYSNADTNCVTATGTGSLASLTIVAGGTGYSNADTNCVTATGTGSVNATATITTNATGGITAVAITNAGAGFTVTAPTVTITTSGGTTANITASWGWACW